MGTLRRVGALLRKDWTELSRTPQVIFPMLMLPVTFALLMPITMISLAKNPEKLEKAAVINEAFKAMPTEAMNDPVFGFVTVFMAPIFLMIPVVVATVLATAAFVGEKERGTLEALLFSPLTDRELVIGKILVTWVPSVIVTWGSAVIYTAVVWVMAWPPAYGWMFPNSEWLWLIGLVAPLLSFFAIAAIVLISQRSSTLQGAQAVAGLLVLPVIVMIVAQSTGLMAFSAAVVFGVGAVVAIADVVMAWLVIATFDRDRLISKL